MVIYKVKDYEEMSRKAANIIAAQIISFFISFNLIVLCVYIHILCQSFLTFMLLYGLKC